MGDDEFEKFLNRDNNEGTNECQKRLIFEIIQQKLISATDTIEVLTELQKQSPKITYVEYIDKLVEKSKQAYEQLDYLMSLLINEIDESSSEDIPEDE